MPPRLRLTFVNDYRSPWAWANYIVSCIIHAHGYIPCMQAFPSLVPRPSPQLSSLAARILLRFIRTASDDSCGEGLGTRLGLPHLQLFVRSACYIPCRLSPSPVVCTQRMLHTMQAFPISSCLYTAHSTSDQSKVETVRVKKAFFYSHTRPKKRRYVCVTFLPGGGGITISSRLHY